MEDDEKKLWAKYRRSKKKNINALIDYYLPMVKKYVNYLLVKYKLANICRHELLGSAVIGLMQAIGRYDHKRNDSFKRYSMLRIRGEIMDFLADDRLTEMNIDDIEESEIIRKI